MTLRVGNMKLKVPKITIKNEAERLAHDVHKCNSLYSKSEKTFKDKNVTGLAWAKVAKETAAQVRKLSLLLGLQTGYDDDGEDTKSESTRIVC